MLASPLAAAAGGDAQAGKEIYSRCLACHALAYDRTGPRHCGLIGRRAASVPGFHYSEAMRRSGLVWNEKTLDRWLANPEGLVPGQKMGFSVPEPRDRADLIEYLRK